MRIWYCTATVMRAWQRISSQDVVLAMSLVRVPMPESFFPQACDVQVKGRMVKPSLVFQ